MVGITRSKVTHFFGHEIMPCPIDELRLCHVVSEAARQRATTFELFTPACAWANYLDYVFCVFSSLDEVFILANCFRAQTSINGWSMFSRFVSPEGQPPLEMALKTILQFCSWLDAQLAFAVKKCSMFCPFASCQKCSHFLC